MLRFKQETADGRPDYAASQGEVSTLPRERLYTIRELWEVWFRENWRKFYTTVYRWFVHRDGTIEPGVIDASNGKRNGHWFVPEPVAERVYRSRIAGGRR